MDKLLNNNDLYTVIGNCDWQPLRLKEQFGQLLYKDIKFEVGKENALLNRIGIRLNKSRYQVIIILKKLEPF